MNILQTFDENKVHWSNVVEKSQLLTLFHLKISIFGEYYFKTIYHDHHCSKTHPRMHQTALYQNNSPGSMLPNPTTDIPAAGCISTPPIL